MQGLLACDEVTPPVFAPQPWLILPPLLNPPHDTPLIPAWHASSRESKKSTVCLAAFVKGQMVKVSLHFLRLIYLLSFLRMFHADLQFGLLCNTVLKGRWC